MDFSAKNQLKWIVCVCEYTCVCYMDVFCKNQ